MRKAFTALLDELDQLVKLQASINPSKRHGYGYAYAVVQEYKRTRAALYRVLHAADELADGDDARLVLAGFGHKRRACRACKRNTVTDGFVCWACSVDNSEGA